MSIETGRTEELGRELGEAITELPEYRAFESAKEAVEGSKDVQAKIDEFERVRQDFMLARQMGTATEEDLQVLQETQEELHSMPTMEEFLEAQSQLAARMDEINEYISEPLDVNFGEQAGGCCKD